MSPPFFRLAASLLLLAAVGVVRAAPWTPAPCLKDEDIKAIVRRQVAILAQVARRGRTDDTRSNRTCKSCGLVLALAALDYGGKRDRQAMKRLFNAGLILSTTGYDTKSVQQLRHYPRLPLSNRSPTLTDLQKGFPEPVDCMIVFADFKLGGQGGQRALETALQRPAPWSDKQLTDNVGDLAITAALVARLLGRAKNIDPWLPSEDWLAWSKQMRSAGLDLSKAIKEAEPKKARQAAVALHASCVHCHSRETVEITRLKPPALLHLANQTSTKRRDLFLHAVALRADGGSVGGRRQVVQMLLHALDDSHARVRSQAVAELARFRVEAGPALPRLIEMLRDDSQSVRRQAGRTLSTLGVDAEAVTETAGAGRLPDSEDYARLWLAYHVDVSKQDRAHAVATLLQALASPDGPMRTQAAEILGGLPNAGPKATAALERGLRDPDADARQAAAAALMKLHPSHAVPALLTALKDRDPLVSGRAAIALAHIGKPAIPALVRALADPNREIRRGAAYALGRIGPAARPAIKPLQALAHGDDPSLRIVATRALRGIQTPAPASKSDH